MAITKESLLEILYKDFGIESEEEFLRAYQGMNPFEIGIFTGPMPKEKEIDQNEDKDQTA